VIFFSNFARQNNYNSYSFMKHLVFLLAVCALTLGFRLDAAQVANHGYYEVFITVNDQLNEQVLSDAGATITSKYQGFVTAMVRSDVEEDIIRAIPGVDHVARAITLFTTSDSARYLSRIDPVLVGRNYESPYDGQGVIVGVIDCGFDFNHINMCDANGSTRVKAVYMPLDDNGISPIINGVQLPGSCYETPEQIAQLTTDDPNATHGTMVAGVAAGSYRGNGMYGAAPAADIVACGMPETELSDVRVANCISYICDYAKRQGKPCVINISLSSNVGPHDGTSYLNRVCKQFSGPGCVFVASAGNDGLTPVCVHRDIASELDTVTTLLSGFRDSQMRKGYINAIAQNGKPFKTRFVVVDTQSGKLLYSSSDMSVDDKGYSSMMISSDQDNMLATYCLGTVNMTGGLNESGNPSSIYDLNIATRSRNYALGIQFNSDDDCKLAIWTSMYAYFNQYGFSWAEHGTESGSISDIAAIDSVISVGAYNSKQYLPLDEDSYYLRPNLPPMYLSEFTSFGPDENGINRPDVCAPGSMVYSSCNRHVEIPNLAYWVPSTWVNDVEYPYGAALGTSMSAPVVAGAIALWMQADPTLTAAGVRDALRHSSYRDEPVLTTKDSEIHWGTGKLDADAGMRYVLHIEPKNGDVNNDGDVNISDINAIIDILLGGLVDNDTFRRADVNSDREVGISDLNALIEIILN